jgi:hypothetical protein
VTGFEPATPSPERIKFAGAILGETASNEISFCSRAQSLRVHFRFLPGGTLCPPSIAFQRYENPYKYGHFARVTPQYRPVSPIDNISGIAFLGIESTSDVRRAFSYPTTVRVPHVLTVNKLLFFFPRAAHFLRPFLVTAPIIEIIGDRGVTAADPPRFP